MDHGRGRFSRVDARRLIRAAWADFNQHAADLPAEPTPGSTLNVMLACLSLAMLDALTEEGTERDYATELVGDAAWKIYSVWGRIPLVPARLATCDPSKRMRICVDAFLRFPFNPPGYRYRDQPEAAGRALDMLRCPVSEYLSARGAPDLAVGAWCNLDFELARLWGGTLERSGSLAAGDPLCDFRFRASTVRNHSSRPSTTTVPGPLTVASPGNKAKSERRPWTADDASPSRKPCGRCQYDTDRRRLSRWPVNRPPPIPQTHAHHNQRTSAQEIRP